MYGERIWGLHTPWRSTWSGKSSKIFAGGLLYFNVLEKILEATCDGTYFIRLIDFDE